MPPREIDTPFTQAIAKAFLELDLYESLPSVATTTTNPRHLSRPAASPPPATNDTQRNNNSNCRLLTLPVEIRLLIYQHLLISRFDRTENPSWAVGHTNQKLVVLHMIQAPQYRTMEPGILQTCKQIYTEANPMLYSQNAFYISAPEELFRLIAQCGYANLKLIKTMQLWVPCTAEYSPWMRLLSVLAERARGLRYVRIGWGAELGYRGRRGLGDVSDIVRQLGNIRRLEELVVEGYYDESWPAYLRERRGAPVRVRALCGHWLEERELDDDRVGRELNEKELRNFEKYQKRGTMG